MSSLQILAAGKSPQAQAQARGKLFETLISKVLQQHGYLIDKIPNVNYAGMEIDIEGRSTVARTPLYAECKYYDTEITSPKLQQFFGKYMTRWLDNNHCQGLFIAIPGINSHAKGFYKENCEAKQEITVRLLEEPQVLETIFQAGEAVTPNIITDRITEDVGTPGDSVLLYTEEGYFWAQYIIPPGGGVTSGIVAFDAAGIPTSDRSTLEYLAQLYPDFDNFERVAIEDTMTLRAPNWSNSQEEVVEVRGSSECFEYQFPAAPSYFVGRHDVLEELDSFLNKVASKKTSSRGILFEANSGWGKSSVVLSSVARLSEMGHFAVAIDSRSASSSQFMLRVTEYCFKKFGNFEDMLDGEHKSTVITGFDGAVQTLIDLSQALEARNKVLFIFLDQFENIFYLPDALKRLTDLLLKLCDTRTNIVLGFSWKADLVGSTREFPYHLRDSIMNSSKCIALDTFSEVETTALLSRLAEELQQSLREDLKFFVSEFSQGYPWLLKKLCAHVKSQRQSGVHQADIANSLLNIEELFQEDLRGLSAEQEDTLRRIAKLAPIDFLSLDEDFSPETVQSLVNARLVVRIGHKYDVYWDIFRDFLNAGYVPVQENYILRIQVRSIFKSAQLIAEGGGKLSINDFLQMAALTQSSFYNVARDMRLAGIATVGNGEITLKETITKETSELDFEDALRRHLREKLPRNRLVSRLLEELEVHGSLTTMEATALLREWCPYISAAEPTWKTYTRTLAGWMDFADLIIFDHEEGLTRYTPGTEVRKRDSLLPKRRGGITVPSIQYAPIEKTAIKIVEAANTNSPIEWTGLKNSTIAKSVGMLEDLGFVLRKRHTITLLPKAIEFVSTPNKRPELFAEGSLKIRAFATFVEILDKHKSTGRTLAELGNELNEELGTSWKESTAETNAKIMLDWARHAELAPGVFAKTRQGPRKGWKQIDKWTEPLFTIDEED